MSPHYPATTIAEHAYHAIKKIDRAQLFTVVTLKNGATTSISENNHYFEREKTMKSRPLVLFVVVVVFSMVALESFSASMPRRVTLSIDHAYKNSSFPAGYRLSSDSSEQIPLDRETIAVEEPVGTEITLTILNTNPVLYIYSKGEASQEQTANVKALEQFSEALKSFGQIRGKEKSVTPEDIRIGAQTRSTDAQGKCTVGLTVEGIDITRLDQNLILLFEVDKALRESIGLTTKNGGFEFTKAKAHLAGKNVKATLIALKANFEHLSRIILPAATGKKIKYEGCDGAKIFKDEEIEFYRLNSSPLIKGDLVSLVERLNFIVSERAEILQYVTLALDLVSAIDAAGEMRSVTTIAVNPAINVIQPFTIAKNEKFSVFLDASTKAEQSTRTGVGTYKVVVSPEDAFELSIAAGAIYSFVKNPEYKVSQQGGNLIVSQSSNDYNKLSAVVALNITPRKWQGQVFQPHVQVGIAPDSDNLALLVGAGFHTLQNLSFTLGALYQRTTRLKDGLSVGQTISSADQLQTEKVFKAGLYLGISYDIK
jgi:hypothetical protein